jgi:hypothetical protein
MIRRFRAGFVLVFLGLFAAPGGLDAQPATPPQTSPTPGMPGMPRRDPTQQQQQQQQEAATAVIKGRVVALDTGAPLRHVQIRVMGEKLKQPRSTLTDAQGVYEFKDVVPGRYSLLASKGGFVTLQYGQRGPRDMGRSIELADKQTLDKVDIALPRGAVITGRVVDEAGEPVSDVAVTALQYRNFNGKRRLNGGRPAMTNDIGQYRLYGLAPGEYYVNVNGRMNQMMGPDMQMDDASGYAPTFYPSAPSAAEAQKLTIGVGEEVVADIQLMPTRVVRISGSVLTSTGKPATAGMVMLQNRGNDTNPGMGAGSGSLRPDGTFVINGVTTGSYQLVAMANPGGDMFMFSRDGMESATMPITVSGQDLTDVRLVTVAGIVLSGHLTFEGGTPEPTVAKQIRASCLPVDQEGFMGGIMPATADDQGQFQIKNISSPCLISTFGNQTWTLKSVMLNGVDITDRPIEPAGKPISGIELTMTNRVSTLTGTVNTAQDQPAKEYTVIVFPEEPQRWQTPLSGRYLRQARPDQTGTFKLLGLPSGRYLVAAFENLEDGAARDPEFLTQIQSRATRVELSEGGTQTVSLKLRYNR